MKMSGKQILWVLLALLGVATISLLILSCANMGRHASSHSLLVAEGSRAAQVQGGGSGIGESAVSMDPFYHTMYCVAASRYGEVRGHLPESPEDVKPYLFVQPRLKLDKWQMDEDQLAIAATLRESNGSTRAAEVTLYRRGTAAWDKFMEGGKRLMLSSLREFREKGLQPDYTEEDIMQGRWSNYIWDNRRAHSRDAADYEQLIWSLDLAKVLAWGALQFEDANGRFPANPQELIDFLGPVNEEAWIAPATGKAVWFVAEYDGENVSYTPSPDLKHFELIVPLFGAGAEKRGLPRGPQWGADNGYYPGLYFRYTDEMMLVYP